MEYTSGAKRAKIAPRTPDHFQLAAFVERVEDQLLRRIRLGVVILKGADQVGAQSEAVAEGLSVLPRLRIRLGIGRLAGDMCAQLSVVQEVRRYRVADVARVGITEDLAQPVSDEQPVIGDASGGHAVASGSVGCRG